MNAGREYDVAVLGLGGMGSAAAYQLARRGARVLGLEQFGPGHDRGSSHGQSRIIRQAYFEGAAYVPLLLRAYDLWRQLEADSGEHLLTLTGGLFLGAPESHIVSGSRASAQRHGLPVEVLTADQVQARFPIFRPPAGALGVFETNAGVLEPERSVLAALNAARRTGADLRFEERVLSLRPEAGGEGATITTERGDYRAARVVVTAGPWAARFLPTLRLPLSVERVVMYWFEPREHAEWFLPGRCPIYLWAFEADRTFYGFPALDGRGGGVKVAFHSRQFRAPTTPEAIDRNVYPAEIAQMRAVLAEYVPLLAGHELRTATCMYTMTPDEHFILDRHPEFPQVAIAAGFSGHGFKFCSVVGEVMADLALDGATRHDIAMFGLQRAALQTGPR